MIRKRLEEILPEYDGNGCQFEYEVRQVTADGIAKHCDVCFYTLPPLKSNYPYHYHLDQEETFYIISGTGMLKVPEGEIPVCPGDILFFPAGEAGAHKLTNTSETEPLV